MGNPDLTDPLARRQIIEAINSEENKARKRAEQRKHDIYRKHLRKYVIERLRDEFSDQETVNTMRKVTSINPAKRIIDEQASLYVDEPNRHWLEASDAEASQLDDLYRYANINPQLRLANRYYKLHQQGALYVLPRRGKITARALSPKDYDVIPDANDPEQAFCYILNVVDPASERLNDYTQSDRSERRYDASAVGNSDIADKLDAEALAARYVFWTDDLHFTTNGNGEIISDSGYMNEDGSINIANPIGRMPFVDVANEKDFTFFVETGSDVIDFVLDLAVQLSDLSNTVKFQAYSQAVISSVDEPVGISVGANKVLWLKIDPHADPGARPEFRFENPTPDLAASLEIINAQLKMFLTSQGLSPGTVSGKNEIEKFTSGIDHLLANLDKFKATREDMDLFRQVENDLLEILIAWQNVMFDVSDEEALDEVFRKTRVGEQVYLDLVYHEPEAVQTDAEMLLYCQAAMGDGLMSKLEAVKRIYKVDDDTAQQIIDKIAEEKAANEPEQVTATVGRGTGEFELTKPEVDVQQPEQQPPNEAPPQ